MKNQDEKPLKKGRKRTDKSLGIERLKTDKSLSRIMKESEQQTDHGVSISRMSIDETRDQARREFDDSRESEPDDDQLAEERRVADASLEVERRQIDSFLEEERNQKRWAEQELLGQERTETDKDLAGERSETDAEVLRTTEALAREYEEHLVTKGSVTTRDEFLAIVSHDLRNPLASISLAAQLLAQKSDDFTADPETAEYLELIDRNAQQALRLIDDLMDMERIALGKLGIKPRPHDLNEVMGHALETVAHAAAQKSLALQFHPAPGSAWAVFDRDRITQVLANLVGNAIKFVPERGAIDLSIHGGPEEFEVTVADDGPGIPPESKLMIFERFSQINNKDRRGLGLGLHISKVIVEAHGGRIWVASEPGQGCTFHFTLPKYIQD